MNLVDDFNMQKIMSDYFTTNAAAIDVAMGANDIANTCFTVPDDHVFEFFLSGTVTVDSDMEEVAEINLMNGAEILAQASYMTGDTNEATLNRNFMLFYKGVNTPNGDYSIQTVAPNMAGA